MTAAATDQSAATRAAAWLRAGRSGMFLLALLVGVGAGLGAVAFRYLIYFFTGRATGHSEFGQAGYVGSSHLPWLGLGFCVVIPGIGGLLYGPLIYNWAREARGHGVPEGMIAVAPKGGRGRRQGRRRAGEACQAQGQRHGDGQSNGSVHPTSSPVTSSRSWRDSGATLAGVPTNVPDLPATLAVPGPRLEAVRQRGCELHRPLLTHI